MEDRSVLGAAAGAKKDTDQPTWAHRKLPQEWVRASHLGQAAALPFMNGVTLAKLFNRCACFLIYKMRVMAMPSS